MNASAALLSCVFLGAGATARAEVREVREDAFTIESVAMTRATPEAVYRALANVSAWWDPAHTWSGSSDNLSLDPEAGGCFCEKLGGGGSVQHGRVVFAQPGVLLRLDAPLGPLQEMSVNCRLSFALAPDPGGTRITLTYRVAGAFTLEAAKLAPLVDQVLGVQFARLKAYVDSGTPAR